MCPNALCVRRQHHLVRPHCVQHRLCLLCDSGCIIIITMILINVQYIQGCIIIIITIIIIIINVQYLDRSLLSRTSTGIEAGRICSSTSGKTPEAQILSQGIRPFPSPLGEIFGAGRVIVRHLCPEKNDSGLFDLGQSQQNGIFFHTPHYTNEHMTRILDFYPR